MCGGGHPKKGMGSMGQADGQSIMAPTLLAGVPHPRATSLGKSRQGPSVTRHSAQREGSNNGFKWKGKEQRLLGIFTGQ